MSAPTGRDKGTAAHAVLQRCLVSIYEWGLPMRAADYNNAVISVTDEPHEPMSPSGAKQWMNCAASVAMQKEHPEPAEAQAVRDVAIDAEHIAAVQMCLDYVAMRITELKARFPAGTVQVLSEQKVLPGRFFAKPDTRFNGTLDIALVVRVNNLAIYAEIVDFKAGAAVQIEPGDPQLDQYLLGLAAYYADKRLIGDVTIKSARLTVVQPRNFRIKQKIRWREIPSFQAWAAGHLARLDKARRRIDHTPDIFSPSPEVCYGCSAKGVCTASYAYALDEAGILPKEAALPATSTDMYNLLQQGAVRDTRALSGAQMRGILDAREMLKGALQAAEAWALDQLMKGVAPKEVLAWYKTVRGRSSRKWAKEEEETLKRLRRIKVQGSNDEKPRALGKKELTETRLKSAPQVEQILKAYSIPSNDARWAAFNALVEKPEGSLTIAPRSDPRDEVLPLRKLPDQAFDPTTDPANPEGGNPPVRTET